MSNDPQDWDRYRSARNQVVKNLRKCKDDHFSKLYDNLETERDTRGLYKLTSKLTGVHTGTTPQQFHLDGKIVRKPQEMATLQLDYFIKKLETVNSKLTVTNRNPHRLLDTALDNWEDKDTWPVFEFREITLAETEKLIMTLSNSSAAGYDNLDALALKSAPRGLVAPLRHLVNLSLKSSKFAMKWKIAELTPRLKDKNLDRTEAS